jgi:hypothetical protein
VGSGVGKQLGARMHRVSAEVGRARRSAVTSAALAITTEVRQEIAKATGGKSKLSGMRGAKLGAGFNVKGTDNPTAIISARGPVHIVERGTKRHTITARGRRGRRSGAMQIRGGVEFQRSVNHPGTKGKHPFAKGVARGRPMAERALRSTFSDALRRGMR